MGCHYFTGLSCSRMLTLNIIVALSVCLIVTPSSCKPISLSNRVLELLRNKYADQLPQSDLKQLDIPKDQSEQDDILPQLLSQIQKKNFDSFASNGKIEKRNIPNWSQFLNQPNRRGRLSIGMTLDALSDMLSAERRRHYREEALRAQNNLHRIGKRSLIDDHH